MKKFSFKSIVAIFMAVALFTVTSCGSQQNEDKEKKAEKKELSVLYPNWAEGIAMTYLAKVAMEDKGYTVEVSPVEPGPSYASIAKGDAELFLDAWLPNTHGDYWKKHGEDIVKLGVSYPDATTGLAVPSYVIDMGIASIEDLNEHAEKFESKIIGIGSGAGIHRNTERAIEEYELDFEQVTSSESAMMASLKKATNSDDPIIITGWKPHNMFVDYDIQYLEDPKEIFPPDECTIIARKGFAKDYPSLEKFFSNFKFSTEELVSLMTSVDKKGEEEGATEWYKANKQMVDSWWPKEEKKEEEPEA
ncbi:MAG: glycine betaine ABC transporter substrate-binding protein [Bacteroidales bacterium]